MSAAPEGTRPASLAGKAAAARERLDAHVREMVDWHFGPDTGCPFWLEFAAKLDFDPRAEIGGYDDLKRLGHFRDEWLRGGPVRRWVPRAYANEPVFVFETGGSTGLPKNRINIRDFEIDYRQFGERLSDGFPRGGDWLMLGPTGPRRLRLAVERLAQMRGGICFFVDLDPRWVNNLIRRRAHQELEAYKSHVIDQGLKILRAHDSVRCLFTTRGCSRRCARRSRCRGQASPGSSVAAPRWTPSSTASPARNSSPASISCRPTATP